MHVAYCYLVHRYRYIHTGLLPIGYSPLAVPLWLFGTPRATIDINNNMYMYN